MINKQLKYKYFYLKNLNKYFPDEIDLNLLVCSKECSHAYLGTSKFKHICDVCGTEFKTLYNLKCRRKSFIRKKDMFADLPIIHGNCDETIDWIDDITYDDLINGEVDCIGNVNDIYIALAVCNRDCGQVQLIVDGAPQTCPKCGQQMFRIKTKKYKLITDK